MGIPIPTDECSSGGIHQHLRDKPSTTLVDQRVAQFRDHVARRIDGTLAAKEFRPLRLQNGCTTSGLLACPMPPFIGAAVLVQMGIFTYLTTEYLFSVLIVVLGFASIANLYSHYCENGL